MIKSCCFEYIYIYIYIYCIHAVAIIYIIYECTDIIDGWGRMLI